MIFKLFSKKVCCGCCGDSFEELDPVSIHDRAEIKSHLLRAKFRCPKCNLEFHGKCGHVGSASPSGAMVTCAGCKHTFQQRLPFVILKDS